MAKVKSIDEKIKNRKEREKFMRGKLGDAYERAMAVFEKYGKYFPNTLTKVALMAAGNQHQMEQALEIFEKQKNKTANMEITRRLIRKVYQEVFGIKIRAKVTTSAA